MDPKEEKAGEIHGTSHDDNDSHRSRGVKRTISDLNHLIPLDITLEILSRLPTKSIVRSLCVSKLWSSFTTLPSFINSFASRSSARPPTLLLTFSENVKRFVFSFPQNQNPDGSYSPVYSYQMTNSTDWSWKLSESVQGLVLLYGFVIWNPTMSRFLTLPRPSINLESEGITHLGYDPVEGKHKVLCVFNGDSEQPRVLTLGAQESWRIISKGFPSHGPTIDCGRCVNGIIYYEAYIGVGVGGVVDVERRIMSFDVRSEKFNPIKFPEGYVSLSSHIIPYEGRLAIVNTKCFPSLDLWILKDGGRDEWSHKRFILPHSDIYPTWRIELKFKGVSDSSSELIFTPMSLSNSFYVLYFDPRRNSMREALFEGIVGDEFRCRHGLSKYVIYNMNVFPNHIESLVSL